MIALREGITDDNLKVLYADKYIQRIGCDNYPAKPIIHPLATYVSAYANATFVGAFLAIRFSRCEIEIHSLIMKKGIYETRRLGEKVLEWAFSQEGVLRITAYVLEGLETVKNYCLKLGFQLEGVKRSVTTKNGKPVNLYVLGLLKEEWSKQWDL